MKKLLMVIAVLMMIPAIGNAASRKDSGNKDLNRYLEKLSNEVYSGSLSRYEFKSHLQTSFGIKDASYALMDRRGLEPGEMYLVGLIHKATDASVGKIAGQHAGDKKSWGNIAYFLGSSPDELDAMRTADEKRWRRSRRGKRTRTIASSKSAQTVSPMQKSMTLSGDGQVWDCSCRAK